MKNSKKILFISDFNITNLSSYINNLKNNFQIDSSVVPFGQVNQVLLDEKHPIWKNKYDYCVIWTLPNRIITLFNDFISDTSIDTKDILKEVDGFANTIKSMRNRFKALFIPIWVLPSIYRGRGILDFKSKIGISNTLMQMNLRLEKKISLCENIFLLDTQKWMRFQANEIFNPKLWYMAKVAFGNQVFKEASLDIISAVKTFEGKAKKLIILDLDNTLWGGVIGDDGIENIKLGGHDFIGEAYADFQRNLKNLKNRGIILAIVSKNEESVALDAIKNHSEMVLKITDFANWRINWDDKAKNIISLIDEFNILPDSVVFIDDNPLERERVKEAIPDILVPNWPKDPMLYSQELLNMRCFDYLSLTLEDTKRSDMYIAERKRKKLKTEVSSLEEWLKNLNIKVKIEKLNELNLKRIVQLLNKTNQMNLSTRRISENDFLSWSLEKNNSVWCFTVSDKFEDAGISGILSLSQKNNMAQIVDFILSCRVFGRGIENAMLNKAFEFCLENKIALLEVNYIKTKKNKPCFDFFDNSILKFNAKSNKFYGDLDIIKNNITPKYIKII